MSSSGSSLSPKSKRAFDSSLFLELPTELKIQILNNLDVNDVVSLRFMSRSWADVCAPQFFRDGFSLRPHLEDMKRLDEVSNRPDFAQGIKHLKIFIGDIDEKKFTRALKTSMIYYHLVYSHFNLLSILMKRLFLYSSTVHCGRELLERVLPRLPNLHSITATSLKYPFAKYIDAPGQLGASPFGLLRDVWDTLETFSEASPGSKFLDSDISIRRYKNILLASSKLKSPLRNLVLDAFCIDSFLFAPTFGSVSSYKLRGSEITKSRSIDLPKLEQMQKSIASVENLRIGLHGARFRNVHYSNLYLAKSVGEFFGTMSQLKSLDVAWRLSFHIRDTKFGDVWGRSFCSNYFPHLENLRLAQTEFLVDDFLPFILRHAPTLKRFRMDDTTVDRDWRHHPTRPTEDWGSWRALFTKFRDGLPHLRCFEWLEVELHPKRIYDENWNLLAFSQDKHVPFGLLLEYYVVGKCPWPMAHDNPRDWRGWVSKFTVSYMDFLSFNSQQLEENFTNDWETDTDSDSDLSHEISSEPDLEETSLPDLDPLNIG